MVQDLPLVMVIQQPFSVRVVAEVVEQTTTGGTKVVELVVLVWLLFVIKLEHLKQQQKQLVVLSVSIMENHSYIYWLLEVLLPRII